MKNKVKKIISFRFNHYKDIELKLEKMAQKGLFLEKTGQYFWTFRKGEPKKLKYTVTYFSEASIFNPSRTYNLQNYYDLAKKAGWIFVAEFHQMQIFCNENENPIPFEINEREKFENIKKCMKKSFLPSNIALILLFIYNMLMEYNFFKESSLNFLAETSNLYTVAIMFPTLIYLSYTLLAYLIWCKQCERSISMGGKCIEKIHKFQKIVDIILVSYVFFLLMWLLIDMSQKLNLIILVLTIIYIPLLIIFFRISIYYLKKKNKSAMTNRVISFLLLGIASFAFMSFIMILIFKFDLPSRNENPYRIVTRQITATETSEYKIYTDDIPLRSEDLYGDIKYENYSYKKDEDNSVFLTRHWYRQDSLPEENTPPEIWYQIIEPKYNFVYDIVVEDLKKIPEWSDRKLKEIDNSIFNTEEAYLIHYDDMYIDPDYPEYLLIFKDKIILLNLEKPLTEQQVSIIKEKLELH